MEKAPEENLAAMAAVKLLQFSENLSSRKWSDAEILEDVNYLKSELEKNFQTLTYVRKNSSNQWKGYTTRVGLDPHLFSFCFLCIVPLRSTKPSSCHRD